MSDKGLIHVAEWSKFARFNTNGRPSTGYLEMADMIAMTSGQFDDDSIRKAVRILRAQHNIGLAAIADRVEEFMIARQISQQAAVDTPKKKAKRKTVPKKKGK